MSQLRQTCNVCSLVTVFIFFVLLMGKSGVWWATEYQFTHVLSFIEKSLNDPNITSNSLSESLVESGFSNGTTYRDILVETLASFQLIGKLTYSEEVITWTVICAAVLNFIILYVYKMVEQNKHAMEDDVPQTEIVFGYGMVVVAIVDGVFALIALAVVTLSFVYGIGWLIGILIGFCAAAGVLFVVHMCPCVVCSVQCIQKMVKTGEYTQI